MADELDITADRMEAELQSILAHRKAQQATEASLSECEECGADIPIARQEAIKGCRLCIDCQSKTERNKRLFK